MCLKQSLGKSSKKKKPPKPPYSGQLTKKTFRKGRGPSGQLTGSGEWWFPAMDLAVPSGLCASLGKRRTGTKNTHTQLSEVFKRILAK